MKGLKFSIFAAVFALAPGLASAHVFVSHFEPLSDLAVQAGTTAAGNESRKIVSASRVSVSFDALGRRLDLQLQENDRLMANLPAAALADGVRAYRGRLEDRSDSWARIVMFDGMPRGVVWDGTQMFAIESPGDSSLAISSPVMYRLSDLYIAPGTMTCGAKSLPSNAAQAYASMKAELGTFVESRGPGAISEITLSAIGDYEFTSAQGGDSAAAAAITTRLNNVDGYFSEQVGIQLTLQYVETHSDVNDPFGDTLDSSSLLDEVSEYRLQTSAHNNRGLTHLFTGRDFNGSTVGVAWRGALCDNYFSAGVSEGNAGPTTDSLISAHEIGHNFNAEHDGQPGSSCENEPETFIMAASVNGSDQFSACSIGVMQAEAAGASCVTALPAVDVAISEESQVATVLLGADTDLDVAVSSNGTLAAANVAADFTLPAALSINSVATSTGSCTSGAGTVSCILGNLAGQSNHTITISTTPVAVGVGTVNASVTTTDNDERTVNNQDAFSVTVQPAVDLVVNAPSTAPVFVDNNTTVTATLENLSILEATGVTMSITLDAGLQANSATWSIGSCTVENAQQIDCQASSFAAQSSSSLTVSATAVSLGSHDVSVSLSSPIADANPGDNSASGTVRVVSPDGDSGDDDDGGGSTGPLFLVLVGLASALARSRRKRAVA